MKKASNSGVYKLTYPDCKKTYIGQTARNFTKRYNKHKRAFRNNSHSWKFAQNLNEHIYSFGVIKHIKQIIYHQKKGPHLNIIERFYIHREATSSYSLNDNQTIYHNRIFDTILKIIQKYSLPTLLPPHPSPPLHLHELQPINTHQS